MMDIKLRHLFLVLVTILALVSGRIVDTDRDEDVPNVVDELLNLLAENSRATEQHVEQQKPGYPVENQAWRGPGNVGQISGVSVNLEGKPVIFHRADRIWDYGTFDGSLEYREAIRGPIQQDTVLTLNPISGVVESSWGGGIFYLPHGLHIDPRGYVWLTDVALHQVFKFEPGSNEPDLVLGEMFIQGSDDEHFCQPTSVAVARTGEIVVADGYCNNRIMIFDQSGNLIKKVPQTGEFVALRVPHGLAILEQGDVCAADRENMRVICINVGFVLNDANEHHQPPLTIHQPDLGRVFAVAAHGNTLYAVNGPTSPMIPIRGFIMDPKSESVIGHWAPTTGGFVQPHAMAISPNGSELYVTEIGPNRVWKFDLIQGVSRQTDSEKLWNNLEK